jgi:hypothetical protein
MWLNLVDFDECLGQPCFKRCMHKNVCSNAFKKIAAKGCVNCMINQIKIYKDFFLEIGETNREGKGVQQPLKNVFLHSPIFQLGYAVISDRLKLQSLLCVGERIQN